MAPSSLCQLRRDHCRDRRPGCAAGRHQFSANHPGSQNESREKKADVTKVILVRHGQTSWNQSRRIQGGNNDTVLDDEGERQCRCLAERLKKENIKAVYSSPLSRAMGTAQWIADGHNLDVIEEPAFRVSYWPAPAYCVPRQIRPLAVIQATASGRQHPLCVRLGIACFISASPD